MTGGLVVSICYHGPANKGSSRAEWQQLRIDNSKLGFSIRVVSASKETGMVLLESRLIDWIKLFCEMFAFEQFHNTIITVKVARGTPMTSRRRICVSENNWKE